MCCHHGRASGLSAVKALEFWLDGTNHQPNTTAVATLRPNTSTLGGFPNAATVTGASTGWQALSDGSDASYVNLVANAGTVTGGLTTFTLPATLEAVQLRIGVRWKGQVSLSARLTNGADTYTWSAYRSSTHSSATSPLSLMTSKVLRS